MEITHLWSHWIGSEGQHGTGKLFAKLAVAVALFVAGGATRAQEAPAPPAPPELSQFFVLNDSTAHLGVTLSDVTPEKARELKLPAVSGAIVDSVQKESAAAKAGIQPGDVVTEFDGVNVRSSAEMRRLIRETPVGRAVSIKIFRDGRSRTLSAELKASGNSFNFNMPEIRLPRMQEIPPAFGPRHVTLGISGDDLTPQLAQYFGVKQGKGVLITEVTRGGAADKAGLKAGDVIVQLDGKPISSVEELRFVLNHFLDDTRKVSLTIVRDHHEQTMHADLSRFKQWEEQTSSTARPEDREGLANLNTLSNQLRAQADEIRAQTESQRAAVQAEVLKQQQYLKTEWQRQLQEQVKELKNQLKQMQTLPVFRHQNDEI